MNKYLIVFFLISQSVFGGYANFEAQFALRPEKYQAWQEMKVVVDQITDRLGYPIEENIKDTVIALNLLGFQTFGSCEGHLDHGHSYPWIDIEFERADIEKYLQEIRELAGEENDELRYALHLQKERLVLEKSLPLHQLLEQFYQESSGSFYSVAIREMHFSTGEVRIYSVDGDWQEIRSENEKEVKLLAYRKEMDRFTNFLISRFLNEG
jgi:hypothetical protein